MMKRGTTKRGTRAGTWFAALMALLLWPTLAMAQFSDGYNFLKAVRDGDVSKMQELIGKPGVTTINTRDLGTGETALHIVVNRRDSVWLAFLLSKGADANLADKSGTTPLMLATRLRYAEGVQLLLDGGAQVDKTNNSGETPLIRAVQQHDMALIRLLVKNGANPDKRDTLAGMSARDYAVRDGRNDAILEILDTAKGKAASSSAVQGPVF